MLWRGPRAPHTLHPPKELFPLPAANERARDAHAACRIKAAAAAAAVPRATITPRTRRAPRFVARAYVDWGIAVDDDAKEARRTSENDDDDWAIDRQDAEAADAMAAAIVGLCVEVGGAWVACALPCAPCACASKPLGARSRCGGGVKSAFAAPSPRAVKKWSSPPTSLARARRSEVVVEVLLNRRRPVERSRRRRDSYPMGASVRRRRFRRSIESPVLR